MMTDRMYVVYLKSDRVVALIGTDSMIDKGYLTIYRDVKLIARFMLDGIEGYTIKECDKCD